VDRERAVLVVVDIQEKLAAVMPRRDEIVANAVKLVRAAALLGMPMVVTRQYPKGLGGTVPELDDALRAAATAGAAVWTVDKMSFCCSKEAAFMEALSATERDQPLICGMETHICVAQTALGLPGPGDHVHVVADACCSRADASHRVALERMRDAGCQVTVAESVMYEAVGVAGTDEFRAVLEIVKGD
jgi:nicotinamidase-related amidase